MKDGASCLDANKHRTLFQFQYPVESGPWTRAQIVEQCIYDQQAVVPRRTYVELMCKYIKLPLWFSVPFNPGSALLTKCTIPFLSGEGAEDSQHTCSHSSHKRPSAAESRR